MMMAQNATCGKLGILLSAATDLFDYVRRAAQDGKAIHEVEEGVWQTDASDGTRSRGSVSRISGRWGFG